MQTKFLTILILSLLTFWSCSGDKDAATYAKKWSKQKKDKIIVSNVTTERKAESDTVQLTKNDGDLINIVAGGLFNNDDSLTNSNEETINILNDADGSASYEIRRWKNGDRSFNGIKINDQYQGWCEWFNKKGHISKEGTFIDGKPVGTWNFYSESGQLDSSINYEKTDLVYSRLK